jgi:hypothetical protein
MTSDDDTTSAAASVMATTPPAAAPLRGIARTAAAAAALATIAVVAVYGLARLTGENLIVTAPGRPSDQIPLIAAIGATIVAGAATAVLAVAVRRLNRARTWFVAFATAGLLISFGSPFVAAERITTALWLCAMHVVVATALMPLLARTLSNGGRR